MHNFIAVHNITIFAFFKMLFEQHITESEKYMYEVMYLRKARFTIFFPSSDFRLHSSDFTLQMSQFNFNVCLMDPPEYFSVWISNLSVQTSYFRVNCYKSEFVITFTIKKYHKKQCFRGPYQGFLKGVCDNITEIFRRAKWGNQGF